MAKWSACTLLATGFAAETKRRPISPLWRTSLSTTSVVTSLPKSARRTVILSWRKKVTVCTIICIPKDLSSFWRFSYPGQKVDRDACFGDSRVNLCAVAWAKRRWIFTPWMTSLSTTWVVSSSPLSKGETAIPSWPYNLKGIALLLPHGPLGQMPKINILTACCDEFEFIAEWISLKASICLDEMNSEKNVTMHREHLGCSILECDQMEGCSFSIHKPLPDLKWWSKLCGVCLLK